MRTAIRLLAKFAISLIDSIPRVLRHGGVEVALEQRPLGHEELTL